MTVKRCAYCNRLPLKQHDCCAECAVGIEDSMLKGDCSVKRMCVMCEKLSWFKQINTRTIICVVCSWIHEVGKPIL